MQNFPEGKFTHLKSRKNPLDERAKIKLSGKGIKEL